MFRLHSDKHNRKLKIPECWVGTINFCTGGANPYLYTLSFERCLIIISNIRIALAMFASFFF